MSYYQDISVGYHKFPYRSSITFLSPLPNLYCWISRRHKLKNSHLPHKPIQHNTLQYSETWKYNWLMPRWFDPSQWFFYWHIWVNWLSNIWVCCTIRSNTKKQKLCSCYSWWCRCKLQIIDNIFHFVSIFY